MEEIYIWSVLITGFFFTSFGLFAFIKSPKELSARLFALLSLAFAVWSYSWFFLLISKNQSEAIFWAKMLTFGATFIPIFYLHWSLSVLSINNKRKFIIILGYVVTVLFAIASYSDKYIADVAPILFFKYWPVAGPVFSLFIFFGYFGLVLYSAIELFLGYSKSTDQKKYQIGYLLLGSLLGFGGGATNFPLMYGIDFMQPIGLFAVMASPFIFSYAAVKYKLMNISVVATQFLLGALNIVFVINFIISETSGRRFLNGLLFLIVLSFTILVIRGMHREIIQREKIEKLAIDLEKANGRLKELDNLKSEFVSLASHQIRGPLAAIKGYTSEIMEGDFGKVPDYLSSPIKTIFHSCESLVNVVEDFLNISRIEQGRMKYELSEFALGDIVDQVLEELKPTFAQKGLDMEKMVDSSVMVRADKGKIKQIINNIIDNAIKYTPKGSIAISLQKTGGNALVTVKDTGIGINPRTIPKLFQKFSRAEDAAKANIMGTGLGLYIASQMIKAQDGHIWVESEGDGKGSTFFIELKAIN